VNDEIKARLEAEAVAESRGYVTDGHVRYVAIACAPIEVPFPWWTPTGEVSIQPRPSVSDLLDFRAEQDG
jgi:hypothetical protein